MPYLLLIDESVGLNIKYIKNSKKININYLIRIYYIFLLKMIKRLFYCFLIVIMKRSFYYQSNIF